MEAVQRIPLFQLLSNKQKFNLANLMKKINFKEDDIIFEKGEVSQGLYIVSEGVVEINIA
jgi:CRP-like cAMP-binding protein